MERKALVEYRNQPHAKDINDIRKTGASIKEISEDIDEILDYARAAAGLATPMFKRLWSIPLKRPRGKRELVKRVVIRWYRHTRRIVLTPRRIQACWEEYRSFSR
jgi:hypothetical protein